MYDLNHVCSLCGLTWGSHCGDSRGPMCPETEGGMEFPKYGRGRRFKPSGIHRDIAHGTAAINPRSESDTCTRG